MPPSITYIPSGEALFSPDTSTLISNIFSILNSGFKEFYRVGQEHDQPFSYDLNTL